MGRGRDERGEAGVDFVAAGINPEDCSPSSDLWSASEEGEGREREGE